jgi:DNA repair exonuclease SbcCD ATPase subunit
MRNFNYATAEDFTNTRFGDCLLDIVQELKLPVPLIKGNILKKYEKEGCWVVKAIQPGRDTEPKTEEIVFKRVSDSMEKTLNIVMQELIGRLCGRHFQELKGHYSHPFGRRHDDGDPSELSEKSRRAVKRQRLYYQDLENHIKDLEEGRYIELLKNDELRAQLKEQAKKIQEQEEMMKTQEEKFQEQDKKYKTQEKRIQEKNKKIREQKVELENTEAELEVDHEMIEKLRAEKRELQEMNEALVEEMKNYKADLEEAGFAIVEVEEEVEAEDQIS